MPPRPEPPRGPLLALARRPETDGDVPFLRRVYAASRAGEMALVPWTDAEKDAFLRQQFDAQRTYYRQQWPDAAYDVLLLNGEPIGRLYIDRPAEEISIMDIALLPEHRGRGIGGALLAEIVDESERRGLPVRLYVEIGNPARRLYDRLGFTFVREYGPYVQLERLPRTAAAASDGR